MFTKSMLIASLAATAMAGLSRDQNCYNAYGNAYPDLKKGVCGGNCHTAFNAKQLKGHWKDHGIREIRGTKWNRWHNSPVACMAKFHKLDPSQQCYNAYCDAYPDLKKAMCSNRPCVNAKQAQSCRHHWLHHGIKEVRGTKWNRFHNKPNKCLARKVAHIKRVAHAKRMAAHRRAQAALAAHRKRVALALAAHHRRLALAAHHRRLRLAAHRRRVALAKRAAYLRRMAAHRRAQAALAAHRRRIALAKKRAHDARVARVRAARRRAARMALVRRRALRQQRLHAQKKNDNTGRCYYGRSAYGGCQIGGKRSGNGGGHPVIVKPKPAVVIVGDQNQCSAYCKSKNHSCNNPNVGSNQMVSCAQACMMRINGVSKASCNAKVNQFASKKGQGGCRLTFGKKSYSLCQRCTDLTKKNPYGVHSAAPGLDGCNAHV